jgi:hypothetical protein
MHIQPGPALVHVAQITSLPPFSPKFKAKAFDYYIGIWFESGLKC